MEGCHDTGVGVLWYVKSWWKSSINTLHVIPLFLNVVSSLPQLLVFFDVGLPSEDPLRSIAFLHTYSNSLPFPLY